MGHGEVLDHMFTDGLQDPDDGLMMGVYGERCAEKYQFTREEQDAFAKASIERAVQAMESAFDDEIAPVTVKSRRGETIVDKDQEPPMCNLDKLPTLRAAFKKDGTVTAATSSKISDGAAATVMMSSQKAAELGLTPLATIVAHATFSHDPEWFTTAPAGGIALVLKKAGWRWPMSTCLRLTKRLQRLRWQPCVNTTSTTTSSMLTVAPALWATPSVLPVRDWWSR